MRHDEILKLKKGDILHERWGYDMIINDYCKVLRNTGKTIKCQMISKEKVKGSGDVMTYKVVPNTGFVYLVSPV